ncbi:MAG: DUF559 domain-containing protein [bacterium]
MRVLDKILRNKLESTVKSARDIAEEGSRIALQALAVDAPEPFSHLTPEDRDLRNRLRARARQIGDQKAVANGKHGIDHLVQECAYEHWHRMLFARFLAENNLLMHPEGVPVTLKECEELAKEEEDVENGWELAARYASRMLPQIFRPDTPVLRVKLSLEHQQRLEKLLEDLDVDTFKARDSLGWVYQFWQAKRKDEINASEVKIGADELPAVTQLFTEPYMVDFLLQNTLGAWWVGRHGRDSLPMEMPYLRFISPEQTSTQSQLTSPQPLSMDGERLLDASRFINGERALNVEEGSQGDEVLPPVISGNRVDPVKLELARSLPTSPQPQQTSPQPLSMDGEGLLDGSRFMNGERALNVEEGNQGDEVLPPVISGNRVDPVKLELARNFRKEPTEKEAEVWEWLRDRRMEGLKFRRQQIIDGFIADFYCAEHRFVIEIDGPVHDAELSRSYDQIREKIFNSKGIKTYRISNAECTKDLLHSIVKTAVCNSPFSSNGEGGRGDEVLPAAGTFDGWPTRAAEITVLDPCCGSGHFLVAAFDILVRFRMVEEGLSADEAGDAVLRDNIHGLEIDERCTQIAAFALAFASWTFPGSSGYRPLPSMKIACSGLSLNVERSEWVQLIGDDYRMQNAMGQLYDLFEKAPILGSLIDIKIIGFDQNKQELVEAASIVSLLPKLSSMISALKSSKDYQKQELGVTAKGALDALDILIKHYTLVTTNVPYLGRGKQCRELMVFSENNFPDAKSDIATVFLQRCLNLCSINGTSSFVLPQNWLFLVSYRNLRRKLLKNQTWNIVIKLGEGGFDSSAAAGAFTAMLIISNAIPCKNDFIHAIDAIEDNTPELKATALISKEVTTKGQLSVYEIPDARIVLDDIDRSLLLLNKLCNSYQGLVTGDLSRFTIKFWEIQNAVPKDWVPIRGSIGANTRFGGMGDFLLWQDGRGELHKYAAATREQLHDMHESGNLAWGKQGIAINRMRNLRSSLYMGEHFHNNLAVIIPQDVNYLAALYLYCDSGIFEREIRKIDQKISLTNRTLLGVPFDIEFWQKEAFKKFPYGLPKPYSDDPTQWIFHGHPCGSVIWDEEKKWTAIGSLRTDDTVLQVAVARLLGYRWPAETAQTPPTSPQLTSPQPLSMNGEGLFRGSDTIERDGISEPVTSMNDKELGNGDSPSPAMERGPGGEVELSDESKFWVKKCEELHSFADEDGIVSIPPVRGEEPAHIRLINLLTAAYGEQWSSSIRESLLKAVGCEGQDFDFWLRNKFFEQHYKLFHHRPFIWHIWDGLKDGFSVLVNYHKLDKKLLEALTYNYLGDWIKRQEDEQTRGVDGAAERLSAARALKEKLELILHGEQPYDIFVRWKPLHEQPIGWNPDLNDGVRLNIRPFMTAGILRKNPNINWKKDRGKDTQDSPWFHLFKGDRINDYHLPPADKIRARSVALGKKNE